MTKAEERRQEVEKNRQDAYVAKVRRSLGHLYGSRPSEQSVLTAYHAGVTADAHAAFIASQEPVGRVVHALKATAVAAATKRAQATVDRVAKELAAGGWDMQAVAPHPHRMNVWSAEYRAARARTGLFSALVKDDPNARNLHRMDSARIVIMDEKGVARFIAQAEEMAAFQYDEFICKLVAKVGEVEDASLDGDHVWHHSILTVTKRDGAEVYGERWKTQQIWNVSKLGLEFPQWPTRRMK